MEMFLFEKRLCRIRPLTVEDFLQFESCRRETAAWLQTQTQTQAEEAAVLAHNLTLAFFCLFQGERRVFASPADCCSRLTLDQLAQIAERYVLANAPLGLEEEGEKDGGKWGEGGENTEFYRQIEMDQRGDSAVSAGNRQK